MVSFKGRYVIHHQKRSKLYSVFNFQMQVHEELCLVHEAYQFFRGRFITKVNQLSLDKKISWKMKRFKIFSSETKLSGFMLRASWTWRAKLDLQIRSNIPHSTICIIFCGFPHFISLVWKSNNGSKAQWKNINQGKNIEQTLTERFWIGSVLFSCKDF